MAKERKSIDISGIPELLRIIEAVQLSRRPQVLRRENEEVAVLVPIPAKVRRLPRNSVNHDTILATAGSWKDLIDAEVLKEQLAAERGSDRSHAPL